MSKIAFYKIFNHWNNYDRVFLYSDPHFIGNGTDKDAVDTHNLFHYANDEIQIANINKVCFKNDLLVFLGDMGSLEKMNKLRCKNWILITGNHDRGPQYYLDNGFKEVYDGPLFIMNKILLSHEPIHSENWLNIHGHLHNLDQVENECIHNNYICLSANLYGYKPICLNNLIGHKEEFKDISKCSLSNISSIHRSTIDRAIIRKQERLNRSL